MFGNEIFSFLNKRMLNIKLQQYSLYIRFIKICIIIMILRYKIIELYLILSIYNIKYININ